jgi:hypothetical protein
MVGGLSTLETSDSALVVEKFSKISEINFLGCGLSIYYDIVNIQLCTILFL